MSIDLQFQINNDPNLQRFLIEYSNWYKYLNRNPAYFKEFILDMKDKYQLKPTDKINKLICFNPLLKYSNSIILFFLFINYIYVKIFLREI